MVKWENATSLCKQEILSIALQGEMIGEGIQKNPYKVKGQTVHFFGAFINGQRLVYQDFISLMQALQLTTVPILCSSFLLTSDYTIDRLLEEAEGKSVLNPNTEREGVVYRALDNSYSFKAISNKFLLKEKD